MKARTRATLALALVALAPVAGCNVMRKRDRSKPETVVVRGASEVRAEVRPRLPAPGVLAATVEEVATTRLEERTRTKVGWRRATYGAGCLVLDIFFFDPFVSLGCGIYAAFSSDHQIVLGPLGVLGACFVPGISCVPYDYETELEDTELVEEKGPARDEVLRKPLAGALVKVQGPLGAPVEGRADAAGVVKLAVGSLALAAVGGGLETATLVVSCGEARAEIPVPFEDLIAAVDGEARAGRLPAAMGDEGAREAVFWTAALAHAAGKSPRLEAVARERLRPFGVSSRPLEPAAARLLLEGSGTATLADGAVVDWSPGSPELAPRAVAEVAIETGKGEIRAGETLPLVVSVRNEGKGALFQLEARTRSAVGELSGIALLLGKVEPGATVVRKLALETSRTLAAQDVVVAFDFRERNGYAPPPAPARGRVRAGASPSFAISVRAVDDGSGRSVGNGDGVVQRGEAIDLRIGVKNTGDAPAVDVVLALEIPALDGVAVYGERRQALGTLPPGDVREAVVNVSVKPVFAGKRVPIEARVSESSPFQASLVADVSLGIDERAPRQVIALDRSVDVVRVASLLAAAAEDARSLGRVELGSRLRATGELEGFVQVEYGEGEHRKRGWLARRDVSFELAATPGAPAGAAAGVAVVREFVQAPPVVVFASPVEGKTTETAEEDVPIKVTIKSDAGLASVRLLVNDEAIEPRTAGPGTAGLRGVGGVRRPEAAPASGGEAARMAALDERVKLRAGDNRIAVEATDVAGERSRAEVLVRRAVREANVLALVVGIDHYDDPQIPSLAHAEDDARAVAEFLRGPRSLVKRPEDVLLLVGAQATTAAIRDALEKHLIAGAGHPEDMAIFYFAGHGFAEGGRSFLAGSDSKLQSLRATALRTADLQDYWKDVKAERKLFVADACHSGGLKGLRGENDIHAKLLGAVEGRGKVTIAAAREKQTSCESERLGHGVFTAALLDGLGGKADQETGNRDGRVTVRELVAYLEREVPALARKEGHEQTPTYEISEGEGELFLTR